MLTNARRSQNSNYSAGWEKKTVSFSGDWSMRLNAPLEEREKLGLPLFDCSHTQPNFDSWDFDDSMDVRFQSFTYFLTVWKVIVCIAHRISIEEEFLSECHFFNEWSFFRSKTCNWSVTEKKETVFLLWGVIGRQPDGNQSTSQTVDRFKILQRIDGKKWSRTNSNRS